MGLVARNTERPKGGGVGVAGHVTFLNGFGERLALGAKREWKERHKEIHLPPGIATKSFANAISKIVYELCSHSGHSASFVYAMQVDSCVKTFANALCINSKGPTQLIMV